MLLKIDHINLSVTNLAEAKKFFIQHFNFRVTAEAKIQGQTFAKITNLKNAQAIYARLALPGNKTNLELIQYLQPRGQVDSKIKQPNQIGFRHLAFAVPDLTKICRELRQAQIKFFSNSQISQGKKMCYLQGPDNIILELTEYQRAKNPKPKPYRQNAAIIVRNSAQKFLLVRKPRRHHAWQFPQGGCEPGETFYATALREFQEELGTAKIKLEPKEQGIFHYDWPSTTKVDPALKKFRGQAVHFFQGKFFGSAKDFKLERKELAEYRFVTLAEINNLIESPRYLKLVQKIISKLS